MAHARRRYSQWFHAQSDGFQKSLCDMWGKPPARVRQSLPPFLAQATAIGGVVALARAARAVFG